MTEAREDAFPVLDRVPGQDHAMAFLRQAAARPHQAYVLAGPEGGGKLHMQTLAALEHVDYDEPGIYGYEQALALVRALGLGTPDAEQLYRRMVFNVVARNQDDHVKNIAFLMGRDGAWRLAPATCTRHSFGK